MADKQEGKIHSTIIGNFTERENSVYVSDTVKPEGLIVPADVSKTGEATPLPFSRNTLIYTEQEAALGASFDKRYVDGTDTERQSTAYLNRVSLLATFTASAGEIYQGQHFDNVSIARTAMSDVEAGPSARQTQLIGSGYLQTTTQDSSAYLSDFIGVDLKNTSIPKAYVDAWLPSVNAHELYHLKDKNIKDRSVLAGEIQADQGSLRDLFNKDYHGFVMDMQALTSLNVKAVAGGWDDDHATHIWTEEYDSGIMPDAKQTNDIMKAPYKILSEAATRLNGAYPDIKASDADKIFNDPAQRYGYLKAMREQGAFDKIEFGNEFVDKYIAAAEKWYTPEYMQGSNLDKFRQDLVASKPETTNAPTQPILQAANIPVHAI